MKKSDKSNIQIRLIELRNKRGFSQEKLAEKLGVNRTTVIDWENKDRKIDLTNIIALADLYGVSVDYLLCRSDFTQDGNEYISSVTGLSDSAINALRDFKKNDSAGNKQVIDSLKRGKQPKHPLYALEIINFFLTSKHFKKFLEHFRNLSSDTYNVPIVNDGNNYKILSSYQTETDDFLYFGCNPDNPADNISVRIDEDFRKEISRKLLHNCLNDISTDYQKSQEDYQQEIIKSFRH